uniref:cilia- and flagella-associated protein 251-like isoform X1 n=1 Tax=Gasterosteus aculeatus aculeatus TaxID=481459 RepID=UPI001A9A1A74|nr:cilia- and flagella-associated protein 251-like isoform X1 [Gasterosteus aculeatus aculeatus]XP_040041226.1 cilia- and flagella-associated protein 251-like isoform X1 [Gasterosteus aculeatus aculeatus]
MSYLNGLRVMIVGRIVFWRWTVSGTFQFKIFLPRLNKTRSWWNDEKAANPGRFTEPKLLTWQGGSSKYKHQEGEKQEEGHDRLSKNKVAVKKKNLSKYEEEEEEEVDDEARHDTKNKRAREEEEHIGDEDDKVPASKKKSAAEFRKQLDEQMWERKKIEQMQRNLQELRNEVQSLKSENAHLKDVLEWEAT